MAKDKHQGSTEFGDVYEDVKTKEGTIERGVKLGRLVIDFDNEDFFLRRPNSSSMRYSQEEVAFLHAHRLIEFDQPSMGRNLTQYLIRLDERDKAQKQADIDAVKHRVSIEEMKTDTSLRRKVRVNSRIAKGTWLLGCVVIVVLVFITQLPQPEPSSATPSIAGVGQDYGVQSEYVSDASYIETLGNGSEIYGVVVDSNIIEVGSQSSNESTVRENIMINPNISDQPIHMRPLYYSKSQYYQSMLAVNDANNSSTAVFLQNPRGFANTQVPANELVLTGGSGLGQVVLRSPTEISDASASDAQKELEKKQQDLIKGNLTEEEVKALASEMPVGWSGFDACDIDGEVVVASYWYTYGNTQRKSDLQRRVAVFNIGNLSTDSNTNVTDAIEAMQMNYQDFDSDYYNPVVSRSPSANGACYWIGYTKYVPSDDTGFFVRKYERSMDIINEEYDNTLSTYDLTGSNAPITNYTLSGDMLFYEQSGYIWVINLSKVQISIDGAKRTITKEKPVKICEASDIKATATKDEEHAAKVSGETLKLTSHYKVMTVTTSEGVEYGIAFIEADTGNLVYQPCRMYTAATEDENAGTGAEGTATGVMNSNDVAKAKADAENEAKNQKRNANKTQNSGQDISMNQTAGSDQLTIRQVADKQDTSSNRILIRASKSNNIDILCFTVRGEQLVWVERGQDGQSKVMFSPVYYKNDASILETQKLSDDNENTNESTETATIIDTSNTNSNTNDNANTTQSIIGTEDKGATANTNASGGSSNGGFEDV